MNREAAGPRSRLNGAVLLSSLFGAEKKAEI